MIFIPPGLLSVRDSGGGGNPSGTVDLRDGLIAFWPFDEGSGTDPRQDVVGSYPLAAYGSMTVTQVTGLHNFASEFDDLAGHWGIENADLQMGRNDFTLVAWVYPNDFGEIMVIANWASADSGSESDNGFQIRTNSSTGDLRIQAAKGSSWHIIETGEPLTAGQWNLVVVGHDLANKSIKWSLNGGAVGSDVYTGDINLNLTWRFKLGRYGDLGDSRWSGRFDSTSFYNRALNNEEMLALWNEGNGYDIGSLPTGQPDLVPAGLLDKLQNWWPMEDASATVKSDVHGTDHLNGSNINWVGVPGLYGNAADFNQTTDFLDTPDNFLSGFEKFAMVIWVYPTTLGGSDIIAYSVINNASGASVNGDWQLRHSTSDGIRFIISNNGSWTAGGGEFLEIAKTDEIALNQWHMIVIQADPVTKEIRASFNGRPSLSRTISYDFFNNGRTIRFGQLTSTYPNDWVGGMDEVAYLTDFLTDEEIFWFWNGGAGREYSEISGPVFLNPPADLSAYFQPDQAAQTADLNWNDVTGETGYEIERRIDGGGWETVTTAPADTEQYTDDFS